MMGFASAVEGWASLVVTVTWQLAALALVAWLCEKAFRLRQSRVRHGLWWCVLLAPLLVTPGRMVLQRRQAVISVPVPAAAVEVVRWQPAPRPMPEPMPAMPPPAPTVRVALPTLRPVDMLGLAWLIGCGALALRLVVGHRRVKRLLASTIPAETESAREMLSALTAQAGVTAGIALRVSEAVGSPVLYGWRRPTVVVPEGWLESLGADELRAMLAHEVAHVKRRDFLANLVQRLIEIPLFFHPGAWLASRRIILAREELCDSWALSMGTDAVSYARSLAAAAERTQAALAPVSLGIAEGRFTLLRRVEAIMQSGNPKRLRRPWIVAMVVVLVAAAGACAGVCVKSEDVKAAKKEVPLSAAPSADLTATDTEAALEAAGIRIQRFDYEVDFPHRIMFTFEKYVGGKLVNEWSQGGLDSRESGRQSFILTIREQGGLSTSDKGEQDTRTMSFWLKNNMGGFGGAPVYTFKGYLGVGQGPMPARLAMGRKVPIYSYATNLAKRHGISGGSNTDTVAKRVAKYDMAIIVYAELQCLPEPAETAVTLRGEAKSTIMPPHSARHPSQVPRDDTGVRTAAGRDRDADCGQEALIRGRGGEHAPRDEGQVTACEPH